MKRAATIALFACAAAFPAAADARYRELGEVDATAKPSCPADPCQAIGRVTGYMNRIGDRRKPFRVPHTGTITAWTIHLGKPDQTQIDFFTNLFGGPPQARIAIVRPGKRKKGRGTPHRLLQQTPLQELDDYFGSSPTFALREPLRVKPGNYVALTVPTWAPALGLGLPRDNSWLASRQPDCEDVGQRAATQSVGGIRHYGCTYRTARLLYSVTYVADPRPTTAR
jgi:hypothetical protein